MTRKISKILIVIILCIFNTLGVLHFLSENKDNTLSLYEAVQNRELYRISVNIQDETIEEFVDYIKSLKTSSSQNWYLYIQNEDKFLLYKDKVNQYIDEGIKNIFINSNYDYNTEIITDIDGNNLLLTTKQVTINKKDYILGVSEHVSSILTTTDNINFNIYILGQTIFLSLVCIVLFITNLNKVDEFIKEKKNMKKEFDDYKSRFIEEEKEDLIVQKPMQDEEGNYTEFFLNTITNKLKENNIKYNLYDMTEDKYWIIEDYVTDNMYKIKISENQLIILLIDGTEKQQKLLENFE